MEPVQPSRDETRPWAFALLAALCAAVLLSVPWDADPGWWDASRHAMDGAFYMDLVREGGVKDPVGYAQDYYTRYPAIAPVLYPPLFGVVEAALFAPLGPHPWVARVAVALFLLSGAWGVRRIAIDMAGPLAGLAAGAFYVTLPLVFEWSREVMLEAPAAAFVVWTFVFCRRFLAEGRTSALAGSLACAVLGVYTKQSAVFVLPAMLLATVLAGRARLLAERRTWVGVACAAIAGVPLAYVTLRWGMMNIDQAVGTLQVGERRSTLGHLLFHALALPETVGWPVLLLALPGAVALARRRLDVSVLGAWLLVCYAMMAFVRIKDPRQGFFWTPPFAIAAGIGLARILKALPLRRARPAIVAAAAAALMAVDVARAPMNWCEGFRAAAKDIHARWEGAALLVSVEHDANLALRLRALDPGLRLRVYRSEKIFEKMFVYKDWDTESMVGSEQEIRDALRRYGIRNVLVEEGIREESRVERMLRSAVLSDGFETTATYDVRYPGNRPRRLTLYRYGGEISDPPESPTHYLPIAGMEFQK